MDFSLSGVTFVYVQRPVVASLTPSHGPSRGRTEVLVRGSGFARSSALRCRFGSAEVSAARWFSGELVACLAPPLDARDAAIARSERGNFGTRPVPVRVAVSNNGQDWSEVSVNTQEYAYEEESIVTSLTPQLGPASGNFSVRVSLDAHGALPDDSSAYGELRCRFGALIVRAARASSGELLCRAPAQEPGVYTLEVSLNDQDYTSSKAPFRYFRDPAVARVFPVSGPATTGGTDSVSKNSFSKFILGSPRFDTPEALRRHGSARVRRRVRQHLAARVQVRRFGFAGRLRHVRAYGVFITDGSE